MENHNTHTELSGELLVTGQDTIEIDLKDGELLKVHVVFKDDATVVPCDPKHFDELDWTICGPRVSLWEEFIDCLLDSHSHHEHNILTIKWNVSGTRTISWVAFY